MKFPIPLITVWIYICKGDQFIKFLLIKGFPEPQLGDFSHLDDFYVLRQPYCMVKTMYIAAQNNYDVVKSLMMENSDEFYEWLYISSCFPS